MALFYMTLNENITKSLYGRHVYESVDDRKINENQPHTYLSVKI